MVISRYSLLRGTPFERATAVAGFDGLAISVTEAGQLDPALVVECAAERGPVVSELETLKG